MSIEKHQCKGGDFHTTGDFLDCEECSAVIPNMPNEKGRVTCGSCGTEFSTYQLPDARVEEIVQAVVDAANLKDERDRLRAALRLTLEDLRSANEWSSQDNFRESITAAEAALGEE